MSLPILLVVYMTGSAGLSLSPWPRKFTYDGELLFKARHITDLMPLDAGTASAVQEQKGSPRAGHVKGDAGGIRGSCITRVYGFTFRNQPNPLSNVSTRMLAISMTIAIAVIGTPRMDAQKFTM